MIQRPVAGSIADYFLNYSDAIGDDDVLAVLDRELEPFLALYEVASASQLAFRYAQSKWSMQEVLGHLIDAERVFAVRALCFGRGETADLPGFDENAYVDRANFDASSIESLLAQARAVRQSTLRLFEGMDPAALARVGSANGSSMPAYAVPWVIAGHQRHHEGVVRERYLGYSGT